MRSELGTGGEAKKEARRRINSNRLRREESERLPVV